MNKIRVALIEDHDLTRMALRTALQQQGEIEWAGEAANGIEGLHLLQTASPDVAIVDIGLPDIDGIELTRQFKASEPESPTRILILTQHNNREEILAAFAAGADSYCMKDISTDLLLEALKTTQEGNAWIDPSIARIVLSEAKAAQSSSQPSTTTLVHPPKDLGCDPLLETHPLTERELEVLQLIVNGYSNAKIAQTLHITVGTVKTHVRNILNKLCADDRTQAAVRALRCGLAL